MPRIKPYIAFLLFLAIYFVKAIPAVAENSDSEYGFLRPLDNRSTNVVGFGQTYSEPETPLVPYRPESNGAACPVGRSVTRDGAPEGFGRYVTKKGDTIEKICGPDPARQWLFQRVNRVDLDRKHMLKGMRVLVPIELDTAMKYVPVPESIQEQERTIVVYLDRQYFGVYANGILRYWGPVSTGNRASDETRTPIGTFQIVGKRETHPTADATRFGFFMMLSILKDYYLHWGPLPGFPDSHGCVRLLRPDARVLYSWVRNGDVVKIV